MQINLPPAQAQQLAALAGQHGFATVEEYASRILVKAVELESVGELHAVSKLADESIRLQPADPVATETRKHMGHRAFLPPVETTELPRPRLPRQFSTRFILLVTAVVAILSTLIRQVEPSILAGSCGLVALAYLGILCWRAVRHPIAWAVFWLLLACYSMLAIRGTGS